MLSHLSFPINHLIKVGYPFFFFFWRNLIQPLAIDIPRYPFRCSVHFFIHLKNLFLAVFLKLFFSLPQYSLNNGYQQERASCQRSRSFQKSFGNYIFNRLGRASFINTRLQKNYELRQYKKGLKLAEGILKKYPDHGGKLFFIFDNSIFFLNLMLYQKLWQ